MELPHLRNLRQSTVMSQTQLSEASGVSRDTISKLETGQRRAYPSTIRKLASGLHIEPRVLLEGELERSGEAEDAGKKIGF